MKKFIFALALIIVVFVGASTQADKIIGDAYAKSTPKVVGTDCPDDHVCFWAVQKTTGNRMCRANTNDAWEWADDPPEPCGGSDKDDDKPKEKENTSTPEVVVKLPTATKVQEQIQPTNTLPPNTEQLPTATKKPNDSSSNNENKPTPTLTPTYVLGEDPDQICNWCSLAEREAAAQETQASAQSTIAAELSGGGD